MQILGVSGSLREGSTNTRLLLAATRLVPPDVEMRLTAHVGRLPLFNPDLESSGIAVVDEWAREVRTTTGLVVSTPEYAGGYPGSLKNAFGWLVGTDSFINKPFMLLNASARSVIAESIRQSLLVFVNELRGRGSGIVA